MSIVGFIYLIFYLSPDLSQTCHGGVPSILQVTFNIQILAPKACNQKRGGREGKREEEQPQMTKLYVGPTAESGQKQGEPCPV